MTYGKAIMSLTILLGLAAVQACKKGSTAKTKGSEAGPCSEPQSRIDQAIKDLQSRNAPVPADTSSPTNANSSNPDMSGGYPDNGSAGNFALAGGRDCSAEGTAAWTSCMTQKCINYANTHANDTFTSSTDCSTPAGVKAASTSTYSWVLSRSYAPKINDADGKCAQAQGAVIQACSQQNSATSPLTYVCVSMKSANNQQMLYQWRLKSEADASGLHYSPTSPQKVVQPGDVQAQALNNTECSNAADTQNANNGVNANTQDGVTAAQNTKDIARFTQNLATARSDLKICLDKQKAQTNGGGAGGGGGGTTAKECGTKGDKFDGPAQYHQSSTGKCERICVAGQYMAGDGNCFLLPAKCKDTEFSNSKGGCSPLSELPKSDKKVECNKDGICDCPTGYTATMSGTCVQTSVYDNQIQNENKNPEKAPSYNP